MRIHLGLGSNLGDRMENMRRAIQKLEARGLETLRVSPIVESPALLPEAAPSDWNMPFLNLALECEADCTPEQLREWITEIQIQLGRSDKSRWSPRPMDIDILLWDREQIATPTLTIPHPDLHRRSFVLTPMIALEPRLTVPGLASKTLLDWSLELAHHIPLWMGILNVTPDSFSDGGRYTDWSVTEGHLQRMIDAGVQIVDIGAESTRPGATPLNATEEWERLEPILERTMARLGNAVLRPMISIDTYHPEVAAKALELGVDMINDVAGLTSPEMQELAKTSGKDWIAMHHVTIPADKSATLPHDRDACEQVEEWLEQKIENWSRAGLDLNRIIFDPGIGFGKDRLQSLELLRNAGKFRRHGLRSLVGHSRKSFMKTFSRLDEADRDLVTLGASLNLCSQGVDVIRVHDANAHVAGYRGWAHLVGR